MGKSNTWATLKPHKAFLVVTRPSGRKFSTVGRDASRLGVTQKIVPSLGIVRGARRDESRLYIET